MDIFVSYDNDGNILQLFNSREVLRRPELLQKNVIKIPYQKIDLRRDRIKDGEFVRYVKEQPKAVTQEEYFDLTHNTDITSYKEPPKKVGLIARWGDFCGISDYSESLVRNSIIDYHWIDEYHNKRDWVSLEELHEDS